MLFHPHTARAGRSQGIPSPSSSTAFYSWCSCFSDVEAHGSAATSLLLLLFGRTGRDETNWRRCFLTICRWSSSYAVPRLSESLAILTDHVLSRPSRSVGDQFSSGLHGRTPPGCEGKPVRAGALSFPALYSDSSQGKLSSAVVAAVLRAVRRHLPPVDADAGFADQTSSLRPATSFPFSRDLNELYGAEGTSFPDRQRVRALEVATEAEVAEWTDLSRSLRLR